MSLLQKTIGKYKFSYQLPLSFDEQLKILDKTLTFYNYASATNKEGEESVFPILQMSRVWEFIKKDITIIDGEKTIWKGGALKDDKYNQDMLSLSKQASQFFVSQFQVFLKGLGISPEA